MPYYNTTKIYVSMVAYTNYMTDARVRRVAETIAASPEFHVTVLSLKMSRQPRNYCVRNVFVRELNISKYRGKSASKYFLSYTAFLFLALFTCTVSLLKNHLNIIHVHNMPNFLVLSALLPRLFGKKVILDIHDSMPETYLAKFEGNMHWLLLYILYLEERICCKIANRIICVNHPQKFVLTNRGIPEKKILVSMNIPDPRLFSAPKRQFTTPFKNEKFRLVYHGTVAKRLGIDLAIYAVASLIIAIPELEFNIFGNGDDLDELVNMTNKLGVGEFVHFSAEMLPMEELIPTLETMDLGIISNRENDATQLMLPVKMLEYVALGIPVVAPQLTTIEFYFSDDMVFFFAPDNVQSLATVIAHAFECKKERICKAERAKAFLEKYPWKNHGAELVDLYQSLMY